MTIKDALGKAIKDIFDDKSHAIGCLLVLGCSILLAGYYYEITDKTLDIISDISWLMAGIVGFKEVISRLSQKNA